MTSLLDSVGTDNLNMRSRRYKAGIDSQAGRRRREEGRIQIRKNKREQMIKKRRAIASKAITSSTSNSVNEASEIFSLLERIEDSSGRKILQQLLTTRTLESSSPLSPQNQNSDPSCMITEEVPTKEFLLSAVQHGIIPHLVNYLESEKTAVREQSALLLGNIAGEDVTLRNQVLDCNAMEPL